MSDDNKPRDEFSSQYVPPRVPEKVMFILTVADENPERVVISLVDEWGGFFMLSDTDQDMINSVIDQVFSKFERLPVDNANLIQVARAVDNYMREHYPVRYSGHVRVRRAERTPTEGYGGWKYRYIET